MKVAIKRLSVEMDVKNKGVEFEVCDTQEKFLGDLVVTKTGLIWCKGKTTPQNGVRVTWDEFMTWMETPV